MHAHRGLRRRPEGVVLTLLGLCVATGCYSGSSQESSGGATDSGTDGLSVTGGTGDAETGSDSGPPADPPELGGVGIAGMRRLSRAEYDNTVRDLLGDTTRPANRGLPEDVIDPFDNAFGDQLATRPLVESLEAVAREVVASLLADDARLAGVIGCTPTGPDDTGCMTSFVTDFGRLALRRPLSSDEVDDFVELGMEWSTSGNDFNEGVEVILSTVLQHPHFIYRVELGRETTDPGVFALDGYEVATRLSYLLWGSTPDGPLLDSAGAGDLDSTDGIRTVAEDMMLDDRAMDRIDRFHAMWLGYYALPHEPELTDAMRLETRRLLEKVIVEDKGSWLDLFTADGTFIDDTLAAHYGLPSPGTGTPTWVSYGDSGRQGLLSHGSFLSVAGKFGDTSPTQRGKLIRNRLMCQVVPPPPPSVNVDEPPSHPTSDCKYDRYDAHRSISGCADCHELVDPIGFGLENYDQAGRWRDADNDAPECAIDGDGAVDGVPFNGPAQLADVLLDREILSECIVEQVYRFAMGHEPQNYDRRLVQDISAAFAEENSRFDVLLLSLVSDEAFMYRREEEVE